MSQDRYSVLPIFYFSEYIKADIPAKRPRTVIFGNFGAKNLGDEAILAGEITELSKIDVDVTVVARNPKDITRTHQVNSVSIYDILSVSRSLLKADFVIVGGGGIICKADRGLIGLGYQLYMLLLYFLWPYIFGKKVYALGIGVYRNANPLILALSITLLRKASLVTVRDFISYEHLLDNKIDAKIYKDNSYLMDLLKKDEIYKVMKGLSYNNKRKNIGLALRKPDDEKEARQLSKNIINVVNKYMDKADFWFFSCDHQNGYVNDKEYAENLYEEIKKEVSENVKFVIIPTSWSPVKFFSAFNLMDYFITVRLHAAIFCYRSRIRFTGITYDQKTTSFLESIGKSPIPIVEFRAENINI